MMGRGGGFVRTKMKNLLNGAIVDNTFKGNDRIEEADLARSNAQFLFFEGKNPYLETAAYVDRQFLSDLVGVKGQAKTLYVWLHEPNRPDLKKVR